MDDYTIDIFLTTILGGAVGSVVVITTFYYHFRSLYLEYFRAKDAVGETLIIHKLERDVERLKAQVKELHAHTSR